MVRKTRRQAGPAAATAGPPAAAAMVAAPVAAPAATAVASPPTPTGSAGVVLLLALTMLLAPALGAPHEELLQDTLKSMVVSFGALCAALLFFVQQRARRAPLHWHDLVWLPLALCAYAVGSMGWSHPYLGGVEAIRWFIFALLLWLGLNTLSREHLPWLAWGIHAGAVVASLWAALQFWINFQLFPQGPNPASTFVNRNFFAEFAVCTLPFAFLLAARARRPALVLGLAASGALVVTAILMTGTRAALIGLWLQLLVVLPLLAWRCRDQLAWPAWPRALRWGAPLLLVAGVLAMGAVPSGNPKILEELRGTTALERGLQRTQSIGPSDGSLGIRMVMWRATLTLIQARPITGVGAGAWESEIPRYQQQGAQVETDYYVHNEFLQLVAEYGVVGWLFLVLLLGYLALAGWRTWRSATPIEQEERPWRAALLTSLLAFLIVSSIGFPWRMAATGALFALCLGGLAASDARLAAAGVAMRSGVEPMPWRPRAAQVASVATLAALALAVYISQQAALAESRIISAAKLAMTISASGQPNDPRWEPARQQMLQSIREGIAINPHYRKITPVVADELARWGDWRNATWIWESVAASRPYVAAILSNVARGHSQLNDPQRAMAWLERAKRIQPDAPSVRSLEAILLARRGDEAHAFALARDAVASGVYDYDMVNTLFVLARRRQDWPLALRALELRMQQWPDTRERGFFQMGALYHSDLQDPARAREAFRQGLALARPEQRPALLQQLPPQYRDVLATP